VTHAALDDFLVRHAPGPGIPVAPSILAARDALARASTALLAVPDATLDKPWPWRGSDADVRYGFYRILETLEEAAVAVTWAFAASPDGSRPHRAPAGDLAALATAARWDLHGRLVPLDEEVLDRDPGGGEWTVRRTLAHIVNGQRAYGWFTAWWLAQGIADPTALPARVPETVAAELPDEEMEADGRLEGIRERIDATLDASSEVLGGLGDAELAVGARWSGYPVTVAFRIGRWSSHLREHTVQVDKTLAAVGWQPREVDRLVGLIHGAYGRLESLVFAMPPEALDSAGPDGRAAGGILEEGLASAAEHARDVRESASRATPEGAPG